MKILATNLFDSTTLGGLLDASHTTRKSVIPLRPFISRRNGSTMFTNSARVNSSLNSNITFLPAAPIARSIPKNNLRTFILSNADGLDEFVLSPNNKIPSAGIFAIGLIPTLYNASLSAFVGERTISVIPRYLPRLDPAGENQRADTSSLAAIIPAVEDAAGILMYLSLYLSYTFKKLLSCTKYVDLVYVLLHARTAALVPVVTTAVREGDATATQSLRDSAEAIKSFTTVVASESDTDSGAIKKSTSILSTSSNLSNPRRTSSVPNEDDVTPPGKRPIRLCKFCRE